MALLNYGERGDMPEDLDGMAFMAFSFITGQMDRDAQKYADTCRKRGVERFIFFPACCDLLLPVSFDGPQLWVADTDCMIQIHDF